MKVVYPSKVKEQIEEMLRSQGIKPDTKAWENKFKSYLKDLYHSTIPSSHNPPAENQVTVESFKDFFSTGGILKGSKKPEAHKRQIVAAIQSLTNAFCEIKLGLSPHDSSTNSSSFEMPVRAGGETDSEYEYRAKNVILNRYYRSLARTLITESIMLVFQMENKDFKEIINAVSVDGNKLEDFLHTKPKLAREGLSKFIAAVRSRIDHITSVINFKSMLLKGDTIKRVSESKGQGAG